MVYRNSSEEGGIVSGGCIFRAYSVVLLVVSYYQSITVRSSSGVLYILCVTRFLKRVGN